MNLKKKILQRIKKKKTMHGIDFDKKSDFQSHSFFFGKMNLKFNKKVDVCALFKIRQKN